MGTPKKAIEELIRRKQELQEYADACAAVGTDVPPELYTEFIQLEQKLKELEREQEE